MTDCGCEKAKQELEEFLHHELERRDQTAVAEHLAHCQDCTDEAHVGRVLTEAVRRACQDTAPAELRMQVVTQIRLLARR